MSYKIVVDSCCELTADMKKWSNLEVVPLTLQIGDYVIPDDKNFDQDDFVKRMLESDVLAQSACPSPQAFADACCGEYDDVYIITITSKLSGCYNSAVQGVALYKDENDENDDNKNIHVFNSLATSGVETIIALEIKKLADAGKSFSEIVEAVEYLIENKSGLYFCLENFDILKGNGRLFNLAANVIEALRVKLIGHAENGNIAIAGKDLNTKRTLIKLSHLIAKDTEGADLSNKLFIITHVCCEDKANTIKELIMRNTNFKESNIIIMRTSGLNTLYAANQGIIVSFNY
ncbi:MAG: DegV family protein [Clostridium sp.]|nr:DegV family protein [Clostridium sp.]